MSETANITGRIPRITLSMPLPVNSVWQIGESVYSSTAANGHLHVTAAFALTFVSPGDFTRRNPTELIFAILDMSDFCCPCDSVALCKLASFYH